MSDSQHKFRIELRKKSNKNPDELPRGYSLNSSATYFNEENAEAVKKQLDTLDINNKVSEIIFRVDKYKSVNTIYQQVYQGWRYLIEKKDPTGKYRDLRLQLSLQRQRDRVRLYWNSRSCPTINGTHIKLSGVDVEIIPTEANQELAFNWKEALMNWATTSEEGAIDERKISFTNDELDWIRGYLIGFKDIAIIRLNALGYKINKNAKLAAMIREERGE